MPPLLLPADGFRRERERERSTRYKWSTAAHSPSPAAGPPREKTPSGRCSGLSREKRPIGRAGGTRRNFHRRDTWANEVMPRGETRAARASTPAQPSDGPPARIWPLPPRYALSHERIKASESLGSVQRVGSSNAAGQSLGSAIGRARRRRVWGARRPAAGFGTRTGVCSRTKRKLFEPPERCPSASAVVPVVV